MNVESLEKLVRGALKGENLSETAYRHVVAGSITPAEHRSLSALAYQISANAKSGTSEVADAPGPIPNLTWI